VLAPRRIAFVNEKGGSAKTTLVANLGAYLALRRGRRVLAIDMDPQGQLGKVLGLETRAVTRSAIDLLLDHAFGDPGLDRAACPTRPGDPPDTLPIARSRIPGLDVVVANKALGLYPAWQDAEDGDLTGRLAGSLAGRPELDRYDFILFDAPPPVGPLTLNVLRATEEVVVPVPLTYLALDGCAELVRTIDTVRERYDHPRLRIAMVVPTFHRRTCLADEILERLKRRFPKQIAHCVVGYHVRIDEAQSRGLSVFEHAPNDRGARAMAELAEELELRAEAPAWEGGP
jgi:chromosome partitioning protein